MSTTQRHDGDITIDAERGDAPRGCGWDELVCTESPTHRIVPPPHNLHHDEPAVFCARHYALTLARVTIVHLPGCAGGADDHVAAHGAVH